MKKEKLAIYPFSKECMVFSDYYDMIDEKYCLAEAASPLVWGMTGMKIKTADGEITLKKSPDEFTEDIDVLLIPEFYISVKAEEPLINVIAKYMSEVKKVIYYAEFSYEGKKKLTDRAKELGIEFVDLREYSGSADIDYGNNIYECDIPVVAIAGVWENTNKFETALSVKRSLISKGYKVLQIGSRGYAGLFGAYPFPDFMLDPEISEFEKPNMFSSYINQLAEKESPDVIIVCIPGAMQMINEKFPNRSGILQYTAFQALKPDYVLVCSMYENHPDIYNGLLKNLCNYRYGVGLDAINLSRLYVDITTSNESGRLNTLYADDEMMDEAFSKSELCEALITDITLSGQGEIIADDIVKKLTGECVGV